MKLRDKHCTADFFLYNSSLKQGYLPPDSSLLLSPVQYRKHADRPLYLLQYANFLADLYSNDEIRPEVYCYVRN